MNALTKDEYVKETEETYNKEAMEAYQNGEMDKFREKIEKGKEIKKKKREKYAKMQDASVQKVLVAYNQYATNSAENRTTQYNMLYRKDIQKLLNTIMEDIGKEGNNINGMNEKQRQQALLRIQSLMLQVLISQYEITQSMNAMFASMAMDEVKGKANKTTSEKTDMSNAFHKKATSYQKNELGFPDLIGSSLKRNQGILKSN